MSAATLLVVDDNPADTELIGIALEHLGLEVRCEFAVDGVDAIARLERYAAMPETLPTLMLLDLNMPRIDGFGVLAHVRSRPALAALPVVVLTTSASPRDRDRCLAAGVTRYLIKPSRLQDFLALVRDLAPLLGAPAPTAPPPERP